MVELVATTLVVGGVSPEDVEHEVEVVLKPSEIDVVGELDRSLGGFVNPVDGVVHLLLVLSLSELKLVTKNLDGTVVGVLDGVGVLLFDDSGEVEDLTLVKSVSRTEYEGAGGVVKVEELGVLVLLGFHSLEEDLGLVVAIRILNWGKLVREGLVELEGESGLHLSGEIGMRVGQYIDVQVELQEAVEAITVADDGALDTNGVFLVSLDSD